MRFVLFDCLCPDRASLVPNKTNHHVGIILIAISVTMLALAYASVPLYRLICQKTGFGGTPQVALHVSQQIVGDRIITVQFNADTHRDLPWKFRPVQHKTEIRIGENFLAFYEAENTADYPIVGMATYNVSPDRAGIYFNKIACFCFEQQRLEPGQRVNMPVLFFIDPKFATDPNLKDVKTITLSYTFFVYKK